MSNTPLTADEGWLIGLLEGEGYFKFGSGSLSLEVGVDMTDRATVLRVLDLAGVGRIYGPYQREGVQPIWRWLVSSRSDAAGLMQRVRPHMSVRRQEQIDDALAAIAR